MKYLKFWTSTKPYTAHARLSLNFNAGTVYFPLCMQDETNQLSLLRYDNRQFQVLFWYGPLYELTYLKERIIRWKCAFQWSVRPRRDSVDNRHVHKSYK